MSELRCGSPDAPYSIQGFVDSGRYSPDRFVLRIACAYLSQAGLETLASQVLPAQNAFEDYRSEWIIGIDHGLSEPRALTTTLSWRRARLRLFCPSGELNARALRANPRLHAKLVAVVEDEHNRLQCIAPSSANITGSAMGPNAQNYEVGTAYENPTEADALAFNRWWREVVRAGLSATRELVNRYADLRQRYLVAVPDRLDDLDPPARVDIETARHLWIEAGALSGPPQHRHQIEFAKDLADYFRAPRRTIHIGLRLRPGPEFRRPLTFRGTARGQYVEIWRLGLLTPRMGGPTYSNRVVRFTRVGRNQYVLEVADRNSAVARRWVREANRRGYVGRTGGASGRQFGLY